MQPFLKKKNLAGISLITRKPDDSDKLDQAPEADDSGAAVEAAAQDVMRAIEAKDTKHLALALRSLITILDSEEDAPAESSDESQE